MSGMARSAPSKAWQPAVGAPCRRVFPSSRSGASFRVPAAAALAAQREVLRASPPSQLGWPPQRRAHRPPAFRRSSRGLGVRPAAGLYSLPPDLYSSLQMGCGIAFLLALGFSALPILTGDSLERNEKRFLSPNDEDSVENIRWSVMGVLSVLPFVNPMAWVFAALDDDDASTLYYSLAFLYALPYLANGFELDGFALLSVLACILHVQVERVAQTEPVEVELPSVVRRLLAGIPRAVRSLGRYSTRLGDEVSGRTRSAEDARKRRPDRKYLEERSREARAELEEFDRRRRERQAQWQQQALEQQQQQQQQQQQEAERRPQREKERER